MDSHCGIQLRLITSDCCCLLLIGIVQLYVVPSTSKQAISREQIACFLIHLDPLQISILMFE